jgi:hypothetical protein
MDPDLDDKIGTIAHAVPTILTMPQGAPRRTLARWFVLHRLRWRHIKECGDLDRQGAGLAVCLSDHMLVYLGAAHC